MRWWKVVEGRSCVPRVPEGLGHTMPKTPCQSASEAHKKCVSCYTQSLLCSLPPWLFSVFSRKQPCEQGLNHPPTCPPVVWIVVLGIECLSVSQHVPSQRWVSQGERSYSLTITCHILSIYSPPHRSWEGAAVARSSVLVCVLLVMGLYVAVRESFCSSSTSIPCSSLYKAYCTWVLKATRL